MPDDGVARVALAEWNEGRTHKVSLTTVHVNFEMPAYEADREKVKPLFETFRPVHNGKVSPTATTGFLDATLIAGKHGTQFMCLSPDGDRQHASDEYTTIAGLVAYRDCMVDLLTGYKVG